MELLGVGDAATELGVSRRRIRQMLARGTISGQRVGRTWVIDRSALEPLRQHRATAGRPWRPESAWALLAVASGRETTLSPSQRSRARRRLDTGLEHLLVQLAVRATIRSFYSHPSTISTPWDRTGRRPLGYKRSGPLPARHSGDGSVRRLRVNNRGTCPCQPVRPRRRPQTTKRYSAGRRRPVVALRS